MDCFDAELLFNKFTNIGHRQFGRTMTARIGDALLIAKCTTNGVTVMPVSNDDFVRSHSSRNLSHPLWIINAFNGMKHALCGH